MNTLPLTVAGASLLVDAARALVWPDQSALLVADLHLGKAQVFRQAGLAMPEGSDDGDLLRLSDLITRHAAQRLFLLGDIVHGATSSDASWRRVWHGFVSRHPGLHIVAIIGNHDRHDRSAVRDDAEVVPDYQLAALQLRHHPRETTGAGASGDATFVIAGHLHPLVVIPDGRRDYRLPCFWLQRSQLILPAFGSTTRGKPIAAATGDRVVAVTPAGLLDVSDRSAMPRSKRRGT